MHFDDFTVQQVDSRVTQSDDYYPFGLTFNSYKRENSLENKIKFQEQEHIDDLGLNWYSFKWRNHQPAIGRFFNVDPLTEKYVYNSPYAFSANHVVVHRELEGLEKEYIFKEKMLKVLEPGKKALDKVIEAFTPPRQVGKADIEKKNETPEAVPEKQQELHMAPTDTPSDMDGNMNPQYDREGVPKGSPGATKVVTQQGGQTKTKDPSDVKKVKIDSVKKGNYYGSSYDGKRDVAEDIEVDGVTYRKYHHTTDLQTGEETKDPNKKNSYEIVK